MTFRPETNPKDCGSNQQQQQQQQQNYGGAQNGSEQRQCQTGGHISTIYDPRLQCAQPTLPATPMPYTVLNVTRQATQQQYPSGGGVVGGGAKKTKALVEKIKEITYKYYSPKSAEQDLDEAQKRMRIIKLLSLSILLLCKIVLMTVVLIFLFRTVQKPEIRNIIVEGEFQILNQKFEYEMMDKESISFKRFAFNLTSELNRLFRRSDVGEYFQRSEILEITPNMTVKSIAIFRSSDSINVGRIGLAFLRSLRLQHGHTYLGTHTINVQSIGFQIRGGEGIWAEWSDWEGCESVIDSVAIRTRNCLTRDTFEVTNVDRCLLIPGNKSDLDIMPCKQYRAMIQRKELGEFTRAILDNLSEKGEFPLPIQIEEEDVVKSDPL